MSGVLPRDPELSYTKNKGIALCRFTIGCEERRKTQDGQWVKETSWHRVTCWGRVAEGVAQFCKKGYGVMVQGRLQNRSWTTPAGEKRYITEINAQDVLFMNEPKVKAMQGTDQFAEEKMIMNEDPTVQEEDSDIPF